MDFKKSSQFIRVQFVQNITGVIPLRLLMCPVNCKDLSVNWVEPYTSLSRKAMKRQHVLENVNVNMSAIDKVKG